MQKAIVVRACYVTIFRAGNDPLTPIGHFRETELYNGIIRQITENAQFRVSNILRKLSITRISLNRFLSNFSAHFFAAFPDRNCQEPLDSIKTERM